MAFNPPPGTKFKDRVNPTVETLADIPKYLDAARAANLADPNTGHSNMIGTIVTERETWTTYIVRGQPPYGTAGTLQNYMLEPLAPSAAAVPTLAELGLPPKTLDIRDTTPAHVALQQHIDAQFAARRKKADGTYEDNYDREWVPTVTLPDGIIRIEQGIKVSRKTRLIAPNTTLHKTTSGTALTLDLGAEAHINIEHAPGLTAGHGVVLTRNTRYTGRIYNTPENGVHGEGYATYDGSTLLEGAYGAVIDADITAAGRYGAYFPQQANGISGRIGAFSCGHRNDAEGNYFWGVYFEQANAVQMFLDLEGNVGGGLRVVSGDASDFYLYAEGNGRRNNPYLGPDDLASHVWIGPASSQAGPATTIGLHGYVYYGHASLDAAHNLIRMTGGSNVNTDSLKLWNQSQNANATFFLVDGTYLSIPLTDSDLTGAQYNGTGQEFRYVGGADATRVWNTRQRFRDGSIRHSSADTVLTDALERHTRYEGSFNKGHLILGQTHLFFSVDGKLRASNGAPAARTDGVPVTLEALPVTVGTAETAVPHYQYAVPTHVVLREPYSAAGTPPARVWQTRAPDAEHLYLAASAAGTQTTVLVG